MNTRIVPFLILLVVAAGCVSPKPPFRGIEPDRRYAEEWVSICKTDGRLTEPVHDVGLKVGSRAEAAKAFAMAATRLFRRDIDALPEEWILEIDGFFFVSVRAPLGEVHFLVKRGESLVSYNTVGTILDR